MQSVRNVRVSQGAVAHALVRRYSGEARSAFSLRQSSSRRRRILVLCLGGIGDTVLAFPALRDLRTACPHDHLTALVMWPQAAELLADLNVFDEVTCNNFQRERLWLSAWTVLKLRLARYDVSLLIFPANRFEYNLVSFLLGAPERYGHTYLRGSDASNLRFLLTQRVAQVQGRHVVDENRALVAQFTGRQAQSPANIRLGRLADRFHQDASRMCAHLRHPLLGIHAGSSSYKGLATKRWPAESFGELCERARQQLGLQPIVFGTPDEIEIKLRIQAICPSAFFGHGSTIRHTAALMARCVVFVSNDSALAHVATAVGVPVVMICGPTDPQEVGPYTSAGQVIASEIPCSPCFRVGRKPMQCTHRVHQACLRAVGVEPVLEAVRCCLPSNGDNQSDNCHQAAPSRVRLPVLTAA